MNRLLGSNYMFTMHKPASASLLDILGPYPWYLLLHGWSGTGYHAGFSRTLGDLGNDQPESRKNDSNHLRTY